LVLLSAKLIVTSFDTKAWTASPLVCSGRASIFRCEHLPVGKIVNQKNHPADRKTHNDNVKSRQQMNAIIQSGKMKPCASLVV
jgi:hypothetical protein